MDDTDANSKPSKVERCVWGVILCGILIVIGGYALFDTFVTEPNREKIKVEYNKNPDAFFDSREKIVGVNSGWKTITVLGSGVKEEHLEYVKVDADIDNLDELKGMYLYRDSTRKYLNPIVRKE